MSGQRDVTVYLEDMVLACERILASTSGVSNGEMTDPGGVTRGHVLHHLTVLGEAAKHVPTEITASHPRIPWDEICRLRDRIVHYYFGLQDELIVLTVRESIPRDLPILRGILESVS